MAEQVTLNLTPEALARWKASKATREVLSFLERKEQELQEDLLTGSYRSPEQTLEDLGAWLLAAEAKFSLLRDMQALETFLNPDLCNKEDQA